MSALAHPRKLLLVSLLAAVVFLIADKPAPAAEPPKVNSLDDLSLEELLDVEVTSVSKKQQKLTRAAAAVHVITREDIRRSGATCVPEALRLAPGLQVAHFDANKWAISSRGFNELFAGWMLVMVDGRSVYNPLFGGVFWDHQDLVLEDIERIEVIRGPGGTLWGANAVNGVVNIITRHTRDTQGGFLSTTAGDYERGIVTARYGGRLGEKAWFRAWLKYFDRENFAHHDGRNAYDGWDGWRSGFRADWDVGSRDTLMVQGEFFTHDADEIRHDTFVVFPLTNTTREHVDTHGNHLLARWNRELEGGGALSVQAYFDRTSRETMVQHERRETYDLELQHRFTVAGRHEITCGAGWRMYRDDIDGSIWYRLQPHTRNDEVHNLFVTDRIELVQNRLWLTLGSKFEDNDHSGLEMHPSVRLQWSPAEDHCLWAAVSRAVHTPTRYHGDVRARILKLQAPLASLTVQARGRHDFKAENLLAYELGYKGKPAHNVFFDIAAFYNVYSDLFTAEVRGLEPGEGRGLSLTVPISFYNKGSARTYGIEAFVNWEVSRRWQLSFSYTWLDMHFSVSSSSNDVVNETNEGNSPRHQFQLHSRHELPLDLEFDAALYYTGRLSSQEIHSNTRLDLRLGWRPSAHWELSVAVQNLLDDRHPEFETLTRGLGASEVPRSCYARVTLKF